MPREGRTLEDYTAGVEAETETETPIGGAVAVEKIVVAEEEEEEAVRTGPKRGDGKSEPKREVGRTWTLLQLARQVGETANAGVEIEKDLGTAGLETETGTGTG